MASSCGFTCVPPTELKPSKKVVRLLRTSGASRKEIEEAVFGLKVAELREVRKELRIKVGNAAKVALAGRVICYWRTGLFDSQEEGETRVQLSVLTPRVREALSKIPKLSQYAEASWTKNLSLLKDLTFMDLFTYLVESKDKTFDHSSMRAYKSLKGYQYYSDGYVQNVWISPITETGVNGASSNDLLIVKCHCFSSLKASTTYPVYLCLSNKGDVYAAECKCVAG